MAPYCAVKPAGILVSGPDQTLQMLLLVELNQTSDFENNPFDNRGSSSLL